MASSPDFTYTPSLEQFFVSSAEYLTKNSHIAALLGACSIFKNDGKEPRLLLLRRDPTDSWPLCWENPGGCVDAEDRTLLHAAARETFEETGLVVKNFTAIIGLGGPLPEVPPAPPLAGQSEEDDGDGAKETDDHDLQDDGIVTFVETGNTWGKLNFLAEVESTDEVKIQEGEHCEYRWVREEELRRVRFDDGKKLVMTSKGVRRAALEAFRIKKAQMGQK